MSICIYQCEISVNWTQLGLKYTEILISLNGKSDGGEAPGICCHDFSFASLSFSVSPFSVIKSCFQILSTIAVAVLDILYRLDDMQRKSMYFCQS